MVGGLKVVLIVMVGFKLILIVIGIGLLVFLYFFVNVLMCWLLGMI